MQFHSSQTIEYIKIHFLDQKEKKAALNGDSKLIHKSIMLKLHA